MQLSFIKMTKAFFQQGPHIRVWNHCWAQK